MPIDASGGVAAGPDPQRGTKSRLLSTECTEPDQELVWHRTGASLRAEGDLVPTNRMCA
jgi:hypothetical protein